MGLGYVKKVYRALTDDYGNVPKDDYGVPKYAPDENYLVVLEDAGFIMGYNSIGQDNNWKLIKMVDSPMGYTIAIDVTHEFDNYNFQFAVESDGGEDSGIRVAQTTIN